MITGTFVSGIDAEESSFDATHEILHMPLAKIRTLTDDSMEVDCLECIEHLKIDEFQYATDSSDYEIRVVQAIQEFFGVGKLSEITEEQYLAKRVQFNIGKKT